MKKSGQFVIFIFVGSAHNLGSIASFFTFLLQALVLANNVSRFGRVIVNCMAWFLSYTVVEASNLIQVDPSRVKVLPAWAKKQSGWDN